MFTPTYKQERGPAIPSFDHYAERIELEFQTLLDSDPPERKVQAFLERNPCMVPGAKTPIGHPGHGPLHMALIARPPLPGFGSRVPDFMWLSAHSGAWYPAMVEIERPGKKLFTMRGEPSAKFSQARNQLTQWQTWLNDPANVQVFMDHYGISTHHRQFCAMERHFILVFGRRDEVSERPELSKHRGHLLRGSGEELMSFDRLRPDRDLRNEVCVKPIGNGKFKVRYVPETFGLHPGFAQYLPSLVGLESAIKRNPRISAERAAFLSARIPKWRAWRRSVESEGSAFINGRHAFWE